MCSPEISLNKHLHAEVAMEAVSIETLLGILGAYAQINFTVGDGPRAPGTPACAGHISAPPGKMTDELQGTPGWGGSSDAQPTLIISQCNGDVFGCLFFICFPAPCLRCLQRAPFVRTFGGCVLWRLSEATAGGRGTVRWTHGSCLIPVP